MIAANAPARDSTRWSTIALLLALALGAFVRFWQLGTKSLHIDEGFSIFLGGSPLHGFLYRVAHGDVHPPLFYLFAHAAIGALHWQREDYRWLTAPMGLATIAATYALARRSFGDVVAAIAAILVAVEPALVVFDRLFRMYAPLAMLTTVSWWVLCIAIEEQGSKRRTAWAGYAIAVILLPYTQYLGWFVVASQAIFAATRLRQAWPALVCASIALLAFLPWGLWALRIQYPGGGLVGLSPGEKFYWQGVVRELVGGGGFPTNWVPSGPTYGFDYAIMALGVGMFVAGVVIARGSMLPYWALPILLQISVSVVTGKNLAIPRYFLHLLPAVETAWAVVIVSLARTRARLVGVLVLGALLVVSGASLANILLVPRYQVSDWYAVDLLMLAHEHPDDIIVFDQGMAFFIMQQYAAVRGHRAYPVYVPKMVAQAMRWLDKWPARRVWYVEHQSFGVDWNKQVLRHLYRTRRPLGSWVQAHVEPESVVFVALFGPAKSGQRR